MTLVVQWGYKKSSKKYEALSKKYEAATMLLLQQYAKFMASEKGIVWGTALFVPQNSVFKPLKLLLCLRLVGSGLTWWLVTWDHWAGVDLGVFEEIRHDAILNLKRKHDWADEQATEFFDGKEGKPSLDSALRSEVNRNHRFPAGWPI